LVLEVVVTSEQINKDDTYMVSDGDDANGINMAYWLREIAYQLAVMNEGRIPDFNSIQYHEQFQKGPHL
jgi:hypothetical protein